MTLLHILSGVSIGLLMAAGFTNRRLNQIIKAGCFEQDGTAYSVRKA